MSAPDSGAAVDMPELTARQRRSVLRWQGTDRFYKEVQSFVRTGIGAVEAEQVAEDLAVLVASSRVRVRLNCWRGLRSSSSTFDVSGLRIAELAGTTRRLSGFVAFSTDRAVAEREFTRPAGRGGPVLLRMTVPPGARAFLVAETGDPDLRYQGELLFHDPVVRYERVRTDGEIPVVDAEVVM